MSPAAVSVVKTVERAQEADQSVVLRRPASGLSSACREEARRDPWGWFRGPGAGDATLRLTCGRRSRDAYRSERLVQLRVLEAGHPVRPQDRSGRTGAVPRYLQRGSRVPARTRDVDRPGET